MRSLLTVLVYFCLEPLRGPRRPILSTQPAPTTLSSYDFTYLQTEMITMKSALPVSDVLRIKLNNVRAEEMKARLCANCQLFYK